MQKQNKKTFPLDTRNTISYCVKFWNCNDLSKTWSIFLQIQTPTLRLKLSFFEHIEWKDFDLLHQKRHRCCTTRQRQPWRAKSESWTLRQIAAEGGAPVHPELHLRTSGTAQDVRAETGDGTRHHGEQRVNTRSRLPVSFILQQKLHWAVSSLLKLQKHFDGERYSLRFWAQLFYSQLCCSAQKDQSISFWLGTTNTKKRLVSLSVIFSIAVPKATWLSRSTLYQYKMLQIKLPGARVGNVHLLEAVWVYTVAIRTRCTGTVYSTKIWH